MALTSAFKQTMCRAPGTDAKQVWVINCIHIQHMDAPDSLCPVSNTKVCGIKWQNTEPSLFRGTSTEALAGVVPVFFLSSAPFCK